MELPGYTYQPIASSTMFRIFRIAWLGLGLLWPSMVLAQAVDLASAVQQALIADPLLKAVNAQKDAATEQRAQAIAQVLPQISFQASKSSNNTEAANIINGDRGALASSQYDSDAKSAVLRQAIFRPRLFFNVMQGNAKSQLGEAQLESARQRTIAKAATTYADYLARHEHLQASLAEVGAAELRMRQGEMLRKAGEVSDIEVASAVSSLATARSRLKEAVSGLAIARRELEAMTGLHVPETPPDRAWLSASQGIGAMVKATLLAGTPQVGPRPATASLQTVSSGTSVAVVPEVDLSQHPEVMAQQLAVESARLEKRKAASDHSPTVDLVATLSEGTSASDIAIGRFTRTKAVGFQLNIPIFSGGATQSSVRENAALLEKAEYELQALRTKVANDRARTREEIDYRLDGIDAARAEFQAAELALRAAEQGVKTGISSEVDAADRRAKRLRASAALARSVTDVMVSYVQHLLSLGILGVEELRPLSAALAAR